MISGHLLEVRGIVPSPKDAAKYGRMQRLDPAAQDGGVGGECFHGNTRETQLLDELLGSACGIDRYAKLV